MELKSSTDSPAFRLVVGDSGKPSSTSVDRIEGDPSSLSADELDALLDEAMRETDPEAPPIPDEALRREHLYD